MPAFLYELYGDTETMAPYYDQMVRFARLHRPREGRHRRPRDHIVNAALGDWVSAEQTSGRITGTWGYYVMISKLAMMAGLTGHAADAADVPALAEDIKAAFNAHFYNAAVRLYPPTAATAAPPARPKRRRRLRSTPASRRRPSGRPCSTTSSSSCTRSTVRRRLRTSRAAPSAWPRPSGR